MSPWWLSSGKGNASVTVAALKYQAISLKSFDFLQRISTLSHVQAIGSHTWVQLYLLSRVVFPIFPSHFPLVNFKRSTVELFKILHFGTFLQCKSLHKIVWNFFHLQKKFQVAFILWILCFQKCFCFPLRSVSKPEVAYEALFPVHLIDRFWSRKMNSRAAPFRHFCRSLKC